MSTSPKSEATVLLWGDRWWLPNHRIPVPFSDIGQAADQLAAAWPEPNRIVRLVFQPDDFATVPVDCPNGNRATLTMALAEEHPALLHPGHVWSHEPILGRGEGYSTLLHYETKPILFALVHRLRECGFIVTTVWPMATWLNALPPELSDSGAMTICAIHSNRFCLYRHSADGVRALRCGQGGDVLAAVAAHLGGLAAQPEGEFVLYVTTEEHLLEQLAEKVSVDDRHVVGVFAMCHALGKAAPLNPRHPAQLLPPVPLVTPPQMIKLIAAACLVAAALLAAGPFKAVLVAQTNRSAAEEEKRTLQAEIEPLRINAAEAPRMHSALAALADDPLPWSAWLQALGQELPPQIVLVALTADRLGFRVEAGVAAELPDGEWQRWCRQLQEPPRWQWRELPAVKPATTLALQGHWR